MIDMYIAVTQCSTGEESTQMKFVVLILYWSQNNRARVSLT